MTGRSGRGLPRRPARARVLAALAVAAGVGAAPVAGAPAPPEVDAPSAVLVEASSGDVVWARNASERRSIASLTKLMTVLVAADRGRLGRTVTVPPYDASPAESQIGLATGERIAVRDLIRAALLPSANDAAEALAATSGGSRAQFIARMNARARRLGLDDTSFATPVGLDTAGNFSSARDLADLGVAVRADPFLRRTADLERARLRSGARPRVVLNRNTLLDAAPWVNGLKTGHTLQAGYGLVGSGTRRGLTFVSVVLGTPSESARDADSLALLRYGFSNYEVVRPVRRGRVLGRSEVLHDPDRTVALVARAGLRRVLRKGQQTRIDFAAPARIEGPLPRGAAVGKATVRAGGRVIGRVAVVTASPVPEVGLAKRASRAVSGPVTLGVVLAASLVAGLVLQRRSARRRRRDRDRDRRRRRSLPAPEGPPPPAP